MEKIIRPLTKSQIKRLKEKYGDYLKLTVDVKKGIVMAGVELHADGEAWLIKKGSLQENIWGGGINLKTKVIDTTAVLNLRPRLGNPSMEILNSQIRDRFIEIVKRYFRLK